MLARPNTTILEEFFGISKQVSLVGFTTEFVQQKTKPGFKRHGVDDEASEMNRILIERLGVTLDMFLSEHK
ncbi:hypothetical protein HBI88_237680 [Parastagonospora nodorum]|nr:hypothetical protein HBI88_237680 [Parastagonospora nodorum]